MNRKRVRRHNQLGVSLAQPSLLRKPQESDRPFSGVIIVARDITKLSSHVRLFDYKNRNLNFTLKMSGSDFNRFVIAYVQ